MDKHIRRLDSDLAKFEAEIKEKALNNNKKEEETNSKKRKCTLLYSFCGYETTIMLQCIMFLCFDTALVIEICHTVSQQT